MVFAVRKTNDRQAAGKDTVFVNRGQRTTSKDALRYCKKRKLNLKDHSPVPQTPEDIDYHTPRSPSSDILAPVEVDPVPEIIRFSTSALIDQIITRSPTIPIVLASPTHLRNHEVVLHKTREYFVLCTQGIVLTGHLNIQMLDDFWSHTLTSLFCTRSGKMPDSARWARIERDRLVAQLLETRNPIFMTLIVRLVVHLATEHAPAAEELLSSVVRQIATGCHTSHPLHALLQSMSQSMDAVLSLAEASIVSYMELVSLQLGPGNHLTRQVASELQKIYLVKKDWYSAYRMAESDCHMYAAEVNTPQGLHNYLVAQDGMVRCSTELDNYAKADKLIQDGIALSDRLQGKDRQVWQFRFLCNIAQLRERQRLDGPQQFLETAVVIGKSIYPPDYPERMWAAANLERILSQKAQIP